MMAQGLGTGKTGRTRVTFVLCKMPDDQDCFLDTPERFAKPNSNPQSPMRRGGNRISAWPAWRIGPADVLVDFWSRLDR